MAKLAKLKAKNQSQKNFNKKIARSSTKGTKKSKRGDGKQNNKNAKKLKATAKKFLSRPDRPDWALDDITGEELNGRNKTQHNGDQEEEEMDIDDLMEMMDKDDQEDEETMPIEHQPRRKTLSLEEQHRLKLVRKKEFEDRKNKIVLASKAGHQQSYEDSSSDEDVEDDEDGPQNKSIDIASRPFVELFAQRTSTLAEVKVRFARIGLAVMEYPSENLFQLREYFRVLDASNDDEQYGVIFFSAQKLALQSLAAVFGDILPTYRISIHTPAPATPGQQFKRDTLALQTYEKSLLGYYQLYLQRLERCLNAYLAPSAANGQRSNFYSVMLTTRNARARLALVACQCLATLLESHHHFNEVERVATLLVGVLCNTARATTTMRHIAARAFNVLFEADKLGEVSLVATRALVQRILAVNFRVVPEVLRVFHRLNLRELINNEGELDLGGRELREKAKKDRNQMSKAERKKAKETGKQNQQLLEAEATEGREKRFKFKREIHKQVSALYFRFLKRCLEVAQTGKLLSAEDSEAIDFNRWYRPLFRTLLEGLVIFSMYLNEDVIYNLIDLIRKLIDYSQVADQDEEDNSSVIKLKAREQLYCLRTIFGIITTTTAGNFISIDFEQLYQLLYRLVSDVHVVENESLAVLRALETMVLKRLKQINHKRVLAFVKRIVLLLPALANSTATVSLLQMVKRICQLSPLVGEHLFDEDDEAEAKPERLTPISIDLNMDHLEMRSSVRVLRMLATSHHSRAVRLLVAEMLHNSGGKNSAGVVRVGGSSVSDSITKLFEFYSNPKIANPKDIAEEGLALIGEIKTVNHFVFNSSRP